MSDLKTGRASRLSSKELWEQDRRHHVHPFHNFVSFDKHGALIVDQGNFTENVTFLAEECPQNAAHNLTVTLGGHPELRDWQHLPAQSYATAAVGAWSAGSAIFWK